MGETETVVSTDTQTPAVATDTATAVQTATQTTETQTDGEAKQPAAESFTSSFPISAACRAGLSPAMRATSSGFEAMKAKIGRASCRERV